MVRSTASSGCGSEAAAAQLAVSLDGEVVRAAPPLDYKIRKQALRVIATLRARIGTTGHGRGFAARMGTMGWRRRLER